MEVNLTIAAVAAASEALVNKASDDIKVQAMDNWAYKTGRSTGLG